MDITKLTGMFRREEQDEAAAPPARIGTPDEPLLLPALPAVKTGSAAQQSQRDRIAYLDKAGLLTEEKLDPDLLLPRPGRAQRRAQERAQRGDTRRMQRNYTRRMLAFEREASDLANLYDIVDRKVPARTIVRHRAQQRIQARVMAIVEADRKRYEREWEARQADRRLPAPKPVISHDTANNQLRASLKTVRFTQKTPKVTG